jgi:hypothetical protein
VGGRALDVVAGAVSGAASDVGVGAGAATVVGSCPAGFVGTTIALPGRRATASCQSQAHTEHAVLQLTWRVVQTPDPSIARSPPGNKCSDLLRNHNDGLVRCCTRAASVIRRQWAVAAALSLGPGLSAAWLPLVYRIWRWVLVQVFEVERGRVLSPIGPPVAVERGEGLGVSDCYDGV